MLFSSLSNGVYKLRKGSLGEYEVYCHMTEISGCGLGGWTLVMKIDGNKVKIYNFSPTYRQQTVLVHGYLKTHKHIILSHIILD